MWHVLTWSERLNHRRKNSEERSSQWINFYLKTLHVFYCQVVHSFHLWNQGKLQCIEGFALEQHQIVHMRTALKIKFHHNTIISKDDMLHQASVIFHFKLCGNSTTTCLTRVELNLRKKCFHKIINSTKKVSTAVPLHWDLSYGTAVLTCQSHSLHHHDIELFCPWVAPKGLLMAPRWNMTISFLTKITASYA